MSDQKAIDVSGALQAQAESLAEHHDELRALSVNVANLQELARVQHEALDLAVRVAESWIHDQFDGTGMLDSSMSELEEARAALAKYNDVMGGGDEPAN